jgi:hypothetical protein
LWGNSPLFRESNQVGSTRVAHSQILSFSLNQIRIQPHWHFSIRNCSIGVVF